MPQARPTKEDLREAVHRTVNDLIDHDLKVLFCGINPGLYSGATGLHFARPGNKFWKALHGAGFTDRQLHPSEENELLELGYGITCLVARTTARADEIAREEFAEGGRILMRKIEEYRPRKVAVLGIGAFQNAFAVTRPQLGPQPRNLAGAEVWLLPNPSGLNAHYQLKDLIRLFSDLRRSLGP